MTKLATLLIALVVMAGCAAPEKGFGLTPVEASVHDYSEKVEFLDGGHCTGTKIGPNVLLLAAHCVETPPSAVLIDHTPVNVTAVQTGPGDVARLTLETTFAAYAVIGATPRQGDEIFIFGNPGDHTDQLRRGYVSGIRDDGMILAQLPLWKGDSGSAVFNARGEVVAVVSGITGQLEIYAVAVLAPVGP